MKDSSKSHVIRVSVQSQTSKNESHNLKILMHYVFNKLHINNDLMRKTFHNYLMKVMKSI